MPKSHQAFVFIFLLLVSLSSAYGQTYRTFSSEQKQIIEKARWKIGPFRIYPAIQFRNIGYDDNVYYQREVDNPASDFTGTIAPEIKAYFLFRNYLILSLTESPEYVYYHKQKRERSLNNTLCPELKILLFNRFVISGSYLHSDRRRRATSEFDVRANEKTIGHRAGFFYETARETSFGFSGSIRTIRYEDITLLGEEIYLARALNREEQNGSFEFYYRVFSESLFFLRGGRTEYKFEHIQSHWRNAHSYQIYSGIRFPLLGRATGILSLGYKKLVPVEEGRKGFSGLVGDTSLYFRIFRFGFRIKYERDCHFSYWTNNIFFKEDRYGGGISLYLTKFLRLDYDFYYGENNYPVAMTVRMPDESYGELKRKDIHRTQTIGFVFRVIKNTGIGLMMNFWERESNYHWANRDRTFVGGYVTYQF